MAECLALHCRPGDQPFVGRGLRRDVGRRVHAHIDTLSGAMGLAHVQRDQNSFYGPDGCRVVRLVAAGADRRQPVIVVAATPTAPEPARIVRSVAGSRAREPVRPNGVIENQTSPGWSGERSS